MRTVKTLIDYIKGLKWLVKDNKKAAKIYDYILKNGKSFNGSDQELSSHFRGKSKPRAKSCFYNAQKIALDHDNLEYFEGWAISKAVPIPLEHGWVVYKPQSVVSDSVLGDVAEVTWKDGVEYFGVMIPKDFIRKDWVKTGSSNSLLMKYAAEKLNIGR